MHTLFYGQRLGPGTMALDNLGQPHCLSSVVFNPQGGLIWWCQFAE